MEYIERHDGLYGRVLVCMLLGSIVTFAVMYAPQPLIPLFSREYGVSPSTASTTISLPTIALAVSLLFVPALSRRVGRKRIMALSLCATSVLAIVSGFSHSFGFFLAIRLLEGISISGFPSIAIAYLNEEISPTSVGGAMGAYVAGTAIGGFVGRVGIGPLTDRFSWQIAFLVLGIACLLCSVCFWLLLPQSRNFQPARVSVRGALRAFAACLRRRELFLLDCMGFLALGAYVVVFNYIGFPLTEAPYHLSQTVLGLLFAVNLVGVLASTIFGRLAERRPRSKLVGAACLIFASGAFLTLVPSLVIKVLGLAVFAFGFFGTHTTASGWVGVAAPADRKATASSLYLLFYYAGSSVVGWAGGYVWSSFRWLGIICASSLLIAVCYGVSVLVARETSGSPAALRD